MELTASIKSIDRVLLSVHHDPLSDVSYEYFRSLSPKSKFESISSITKFPKWVDTDIDIRDDIVYYYKCRIKTKYKSVFTPVVDLKKPDDVFPPILEMARQFFLMLETIPGIGHNLLYYMKTDSGVPCECYDQILQKRIKKKCPKCGGSGFIGGYIGPINIKVGYRTYQDINIDTGDRNIEKKLKYFWTCNIPIIKEDDILVDANKYKWKVINVKNISPCDFLVRQDLVVAQLSKYDAEYSMGDESSDKVMTYTKEGINLEL